MKKLLVVLLVLFSHINALSWRDPKVIVPAVSAVTISSAAIAYYYLKPQPQPIPVTHIGVLKMNDNIADDTLMRKLYEFGNASLQAVLLIVNSNGGDIGMSELCFKEIKALSAIKPVVVLVESQCCSGAYLAAVGANWIIAPASAIIGNIGVYIPVEKHTNPKYHSDTYSADLEFEFIYAGKFKIATQANAAPITDEIRQELQKGANSRYQIFLETVAQQRNVSLENSPEWADARDFNGHQALANGLIDQVGGFSDAVNKIKELITARGGTVENELVFVE